jgi:hypothetical protein
MGDVAGQSLGNQEVGQLGQAPGGKRQAVVNGAGLGDLLDLPPLAEGELRRMAALVPGIQRAEPIGVEVADPSRTRSSLVNATFAIAAASMPWAGSSTICARRQVTTDRLPRRMIRTSRRPS